MRQSPGEQIAKYECRAWHSVRVAAGASRSSKAGWLRNVDRRLGHCNIEVRWHAVYRSSVYGSFWPDADSRIPALAAIGTTAWLCSLPEIKANSLAFAAVETHPKSGPSRISRSCPHCARSIKGDSTPCSFGALVQGKYTASVGMPLNAIVLALMPFVLFVDIKVVLYVRL
jgi:hypothetical protein